YIDFNVLDNISYKYVIYLFDNFNFYSKSNEVSATTLNREPEPVTLYEPSDVTDSTMTLTWEISQIHDFRKYALYRSLSDNHYNTSNVVFETSNKYENMFTDTELEANTVYFYRLGVYDTGDLFSLSNIVNDTAKTPSALIAYYPFNGNARDKSGNGNHGTVFGAVLTTDRFGNPESAYMFDGDSSYIDIGNSISLANSSFSLALWAKRSGSRKDHIILGHGIPSPNGCLHVGFLLSNEFIFAFYGSDLKAPDIYSDLNWHHWTCTYDAIEKAMKIYRDASLIASRMASSNYIGSGIFYIGKAAWNRDYFKGFVDEVRIYNRDLTETEIQALYHE
ncbi:MAG: LamG-like jellyroll fold domain-containing protein, partial [Promethearchaeota archaeon]